MVANEDVLVDISLGGEVRGIATNVHSVRVLVDTNVVDSHSRWEGEVFQIHCSEICRHAQIHNDILQIDVRGRSQVK